MMVERSMRAAIARLGIGDVFRFAGFCDHPALITLGNGHDIFMSPSVSAADGDTEGGAPVTIIEMAALGMPIASTTHCDIPGVLAPANRALLVAERDSAALAQVLLRLTDNPNEWARIGRENRVYIEQYFDLRKQGAMLTEIYNDVARDSQGETRNG